MNELEGTSNFIPVYGKFDFSNHHRIFIKFRVNELKSDGA